MCGRDRRVVVMEMLRCRRLLTDWQVSLLAEHSHLVVPRHIQKRRRRRHTIAGLLLLRLGRLSPTPAAFSTLLLCCSATRFSRLIISIHPSSSGARRGRIATQDAAERRRRAPSTSPTLFSPSSRIKCVLCVYMCCIFFSYQLNRTEINKISCVMMGYSYSCFFLEGLIYIIHLQIFDDRV